MEIRLSAFNKTRPSFVGVDSDGCVFDNMEIKHKECFVPAYIRDFGLQPVASAARETWEFVNLYSRRRGINRFRGLIDSLDLLREHPDVIRRGASIPELPTVRRWIEETRSLGGVALEEAVEACAAGSPEREEMELIRHWSVAVNAAVEEIVRRIPPFPYARKSLERIHDSADLVIVSSAPEETLRREWREQGLDGFVSLVAGQEAGSKEEHLRATADGRYELRRVLMVGDAPGDLKAAKSVGALFYPIIPGAEAESWRRFHEDALDRFLNDEYAGAYEQERTEAFLSSLPEEPPWDAAN